jgi:hypothetical protein
MRFFEQMLFRFISATAVAPEWPGPGQKLQLHSRINNYRLL